MSRYGLLIVLVGMTHTVHSQGRDDGSLYSRYGIGELTSFASSQAQALGGASTSLFSDDYMNFGNPATWSRQTLVRLAVGAQFDRLQARDAFGRSEQLLRGNFNALQVGIPLLAGKLGLGLSYEPYSRSHFRVTTTGTLEQDLLYEINYEGSGGIHRTRIGFGLQLNSWASVGASADILFGILEEGRRTTFSHADFLETNLVKTTRLAGFSPSVGVALSFDGENYTIVVGAGGAIPPTLHGTQTYTLGQNLDLDTLGTVQNGNIKLPYRISGGVSFRYQDRWLFIADVEHAPWSTASTTLPFPAFEPDKLRDRFRYSAGIELIPEANSIQARYLSRTAYRLGFYKDNLYISPVANREIFVTAITGGLGLPTLFPGTRLDLSFEFGTRGTTSANLIRDRFIGVSATLNVGERWFVKRKLG